ncbi:MAG: hypothetical protein ACR2NG_06675 [Acidimicrobiia bacterium]
MRRHLLLLVVLLLLLTVVVAAPASAKKPLHGDQVMLLNEIPDVGFGLYGCPDVSWFGAVEINGETYGMALYPDPATRFPVGKSDIMIYVESWKIWSEQFTLTDGEVDDCDPGTALLAGSDHGVAHFDTGVFHSNGKVTEADTPFDEWMNRRVKQKGTIGLVEFDGVPGVGFEGSMRLN